MNLLRREPVLARTLVAGLVAALTHLLVSFGLHLTADQSQSILTLVDGILVLAAALSARQVVTPIAGPRDGNGVTLPPAAPAPAPAVPVEVVPVLAPAAVEVAPAAVEVVPAPADRPPLFSMAPTPVVVPDGLAPADPVKGAVDALVVALDTRLHDSQTVL